jgi:hypothetical protein
VGLRGLVKHGVGQAAQRIHGLLQDAGRLDAGVGHDQRLADAHALAFLAQQLHGAKVELDLGDVVDESHVGIAPKQTRMENVSM